jgi:hypothetical protein
MEAHPLLDKVLLAAKEIMMVKDQREVAEEQVLLGALQMELLLAALEEMV